MGKKNQDSRWIKNAARMAHEMCRAHDLACNADALPPWKELSKETKKSRRLGVVAVISSGCTTPDEWFSKHCATDEELSLMSDETIARIRVQEYLTFTAVMQTLRLVG